MKATSVAFIIGVLASLNCKFDEHHQSQIQGALFLGSSNYCVAQALFRPELGTFTEGGDSLSQAQSNAYNACVGTAGELAGCVVEHCGFGKESSQSSFLGPAICQWEDAKPDLDVYQLGGYTDGPTREEARANALQDCQAGPGHPPGVNCQVIACVAKDAHEPTR